jgi:16S rRNA (uracil1498-N3)-methyltransferase
VTRRFHTPRLVLGLNRLDAQQGRHARDVLRLEEGAEVELFDDAGIVAAGVLVYEGGKAAVRISRLEASAATPAVLITIAAAIPKGERADWMVEKLSELGVAVFIPLAAERSVVLPEGTNKRERWQRIATESAKQSRRHGVMRIEPLAKVEDVLGSQTICLSTRDDAKPLPEVLSELHDADAVTLLIGPEGGWTDAELQNFESVGVRFAKMTETILRIETAAIAAAAVTAMLLRCSP